MKQIIVIASKVVGTLTGLVAAVWGVFAFYHGIMDRFDKIDESIEYINIEQAFISKDILSIHDTLTVMNGSIQYNTGMNERLIWMEKNRRQFTPEQMEILLEEFLKKNYGSMNSEWTPYVMHRYDDTIKQENTKSYSNL